MKVKLLVSMAGPTAAHNAGDEIDVDDATAKRFIERNMEMLRCFFPLGTCFSLNIVLSAVFKFFRSSS